MTTNKISAGTIARTIILLLALINQCLSMAGVSPLPIEDEQVETIITSRPARGAWIEMLEPNNSVEMVIGSRPARGAWIEIVYNISS